eukprot:TRINITY_DN52161_c0_g1_i1.p1 TRINITY_DN52161_c0_g1~~TRINITY_DN52161_c0_g1_i1.p1  ORF type:complete len:440 (+),score=94.03 TRINITY_DN52161_c0_g1_i1:90-1409(+)
MLGERTHVGKPVDVGWNTILELATKKTKTRRGPPSEPWNSHFHSCGYLDTLQPVSVLSQVSVRHSQRSQRQSAACEGSGPQPYRRPLPEVRGYPSESCLHARAAQKTGKAKPWNPLHSGGSPKAFSEAPQEGHSSGKAWAYIDDVLRGSQRKKGFVRERDGKMHLKLASSKAEVMLQGPKKHQPEDNATEDHAAAVRDHPPLKGKVVGKLALRRRRDGRMGDNADAKRPEPGNRRRRASQNVLAYEAAARIREVFIAALERITGMEWSAHHLWDILHSVDEVGHGRLDREQIRWAVRVEMKIRCSDLTEDDLTEFIGSFHCDPESWRPIRIGDIMDFILQEGAYAPVNELVDLARNLQKTMRSRRKITSGGGQSNPRLQNDAAAFIQRTWREYRRLCVGAAHLLKRLCVIKLQAAWRGRCERRKAAVKAALKSARTVFS